MRNGLEEVAKRIMYRVEMGEMSGIAYDTGWVARLSHGKRWDAFPRCVGWLERNQHEDGSWGGALPHNHDRVISTLSAVLALTEKPGWERVHRHRIRRAESFLWEAIPRLKDDPCETIGFELVFPEMMREAEKRGMALPYSAAEKYEQMREKKLSLIPSLDVIYGDGASVAYSLEGLGDSLDTQRAKKMRLVDGSVLTSPSATAFLLRKVDRPEAWRYMYRVYRQSWDGGITPQYPAEMFEILWTVYNFLNARIPSGEHYLDHIDHVLASIKDRGVSWTGLTSLTEADDTAMALKILNEFNCPADASVLEKYERDEFFSCFDFEMNPSVSTNIHVLDAVKDMENYPRREEVVEKILRFLKKDLGVSGYWQDKWHISPFYATAHGVIAVEDVDPELAERAVNWIISKQRGDGGWGLYRSTAEETALALQALFSFSEKVDMIDPAVIGNGLGWLVENESFSREELWVAKGLYTPLVVVDSLVVSVLYTGISWLRRGLLEPQMVRYSGGELAALAAMEGSNTAWAPERDAIRVTNGDGPGGGGRS